jgi:hypothetical protein
VGVHGAILVADLTRKETLESLERYWIPFLFKVVEDIPMVFVCNKSDLRDNYAFQPEEMEEMAKRYNGFTDGILTNGLSSSYTTSAKDGINVERTFESLGHLVLTKKSYEDPVKRISEILKATGIKRNIDRSTPIGGLDAIMVDFCEGFKDSRVAMIIIRQEIARAGIDINNPKKEGLHKLVEYLADAEMEFLDEDTVFLNLERRSDMARSIRE